MYDHGIGAFNRVISESNGRLVGGAASPPFHGEAPRAPEVLIGLDRVEKGIVVARELTAHLVNAVSPVLRPQPPADKAPAASTIPACRSTVADQLAGLADQLHDLHATLQLAIGRVDV